MLFTLWLPVSRRCSPQAAQAPPSKHPGAAKRSRGLNAATPGSSPLSMRLGLWSGWMGKTRKTAVARKSAAIEYCEAWSWRLNFFMNFFAYDFGGEEWRPSDFQAWIIEGRIPKRARSRLERDSASRKSNPISRDREEFGSGEWRIGSRRTASDFRVKDPGFH